MFSCWCTETGPSRRRGGELASTPCAAKHLEMACASEAAVNSSSKEPLGTPAQRIMSPPLRWLPACRSRIPHLLGHVYQINYMWFGDGFPRLEDGENAGYKGADRRLGLMRCAKLGHETSNSEQL